MQIAHRTWFVILYGEMLWMRHSHNYQPFHTDDGDVIALYCVKAADIGGRTLLASSWTIYNRLLQTRPDICEILKKDWLWDS